MLAIDEARRDGAVVEDTLKNYISGGLLPLRRNHEMDTKYCSFEFAAKLWLMNGLDIPSLPTSLEASLSRRFLCTFMRNTLTFDKTAANVSQCVFPCDPEAKTFCSSPAAVWSFYNDWLLPFMDKHDPTACQKLLTEISPESQVAKDCARKDLWQPVRTVNMDTDDICFLEINTYVYIYIPCIYMYIYIYSLHIYVYIYIPCIIYINKYLHLFHFTYV